jgi:hypothetical protein
MPDKPARDVPEKFLVAFSYASDQSRLVHEIAEAVEARLGRSKVFLDKWWGPYITGINADLKLQRIYRESCEVAIVCVSKEYNDKIWPGVESRGIRDRMYSKAASEAEGVLPIRVGVGDVEGFSENTDIFLDATKMQLEEIVEQIVDRVHRITRPPWPNEPTLFEHGLCDRDVWSAIQRLMTVNAAKRILIFKGPSGYSKSALLGAAASYAKILCLPVAYVDFKDTQLLRLTGFLKSLRLDLGALLPGFALATEPDPWTLLEALRRLSSPVLIVLDSYEQITATRELVDWIEIILLAEVEHCKQIRFLVGGQKVPERTHNRWRDLAEEIELDKINDKQAWTVWIQHQNPDVHDKLVEGTVLALDGVPSTISGFLTTVAEKLTPTA